MKEKKTNYQFKYRVLAEALYESLKADPFYITIEKTIQGSLAIRKEAMLRYLDYSMIEGENYGELYLPKEHCFGASVWSKPLHKEIELERKTKKTQFLVEQMGQETLDRYSLITEFMSKKTLKLISPESSYLSIVGLKPSQQNKGLGAGLIIPTLAEMDRQKISTYLETFTPRNMKFYQRLGYSSIDSFQEPTTNSTYWIMLREPELIKITGYNNLL